MMKNARTSLGVWLHLCPFGWHICNFLIKKITSIPFQKNTRRTQEDALAFLLDDMYLSYLYHFR
jgi:hypothetical protein